MKRVYYPEELIKKICQTLETYTGIHSVRYSVENSLENSLVKFKIYLDTVTFNKSIPPLFYGGLEDFNLDLELIVNIILDDIADELIKNRICLDYDDFDIKVGRLAGVPVSQYKNTEEREDSNSCTTTVEWEVPTLNNSSNGYYSEINKEEFIMEIDKSYTWYKMHGIDDNSHEYNIYFRR